MPHSHRGIIILKGHAHLQGVQVGAQYTVHCENSLKKTRYGLTQTGESSNWHPAPCLRIGMLCCGPRSINHIIPPTKKRKLRKTQGDTANGPRVSLSHVPTTYGASQGFIFSLKGINNMCLRWRDLYMLPIFWICVRHNPLRWRRYGTLRFTPSLYIAVGIMHFPFIRSGRLPERPLLPPGPPFSRRTNEYSQYNKHRGAFLWPRPTRNSKQIRLVRKGQLDILPK